jgi:HK97 family phage portal protein
MSRLPRPKAMSPDDDRWYSPGGNYYGGLIPTQAGVPMDSDTAMRLITVQNCVRVRAATISQLPLHLMRSDGEMKHKATDFYLYEMLHDQPNSWMTAPEFWGMVEAYVCLRGNFYAYKLGIEGRPIQELIPILPDAVDKVEQNDDYSLTYSIKLKDGTTKPYPQNKIFHIRGLTMNGYTGMNPIEHARETLGLGMASEKFLSRYFGKGLHPSAIIEHPSALSAPAHKNMKAVFTEKYAGLYNSQELMLIDEGMKINFPTIKLVDAQYLELMKMNQSQICGLFRVPLMLVQASDNPETYASAEQFFLNYSIIGVTPDCVNYEKAIRRDLLTPTERKTLYAKFNVDAMLRGDFKTRMEGYQIGINSEMLSPNDARAKEDMNPYKGGEIYRSRTSTIREENKKTDNKDNVE